MDTRELVRDLHDKRQGLIDEFRKVQEEVHAGTADAERQAKGDELNGQIGELGTRIQGLQTMIEHEQQASADRAKFAEIVGKPHEVETQAENFQHRVRNWLRAGLPDAETWAPKAITMSTRGVVVKHDRATFAPQVMEQHDLTKGTATDGAELIPTSFVRRLYEHMIEFAAIRRTNATVLRTDSGENLLVPKTTSYGSAALVAEAGPIAEDDPQFAQVTVGAYKFGQLIQISRELIEDSAVDILDFLARSAGRALGVVTGTYYVTGTGSAQPQGIANSPTAGVTAATGGTTTVTVNNLIDLYHSLISGYRANGWWVMNDATAAFLRKIRDDTGGAGVGNLMWQPGLVAGAPDTLLGRPVVTDPTMPTMAANAYSVAFGDFSEYFVIRDVDGMRFERSDDFAFANDLVTFRALLRTDSRQLLNGASGAVKFFRNSAT